jgi:hypothetical protein
VTICRFNGPDQPRTLAGRHLDPDEMPPGTLHPDSCRGCLPCPDDHCVVCTHEHTTDTHPLTCPECVAGIRDDLKAIPPLSLALFEHATDANGGRLAAAPIPGGEATVMISPAAMTPHGRAWYDEQKRDASHKTDERDEDAATPMLVLASWEDTWRATLNDPAEGRTSLRRSSTYLLDHLTSVAQKPDPPIDAFQEEIATLRYHLEEVLGAGIRNQPGAPCTSCGQALVRISSKPATCAHAKLAQSVADLADEPRFTINVLLQTYPVHAAAHAHCDQGGLRDTWQCLRCKRRYTDQEYQFAVGSDYINNARSLTARELEWKTGVPATVIRTWGSRRLIAKRGRDEFGLIRYDVDQVEARVPEYEAVMRAAAERAAARAAKAEVSAPA